MKKYPRLYDKFHIGDQVLSVNDVQVTDLAFTSKIVKHIKAEYVELTIRRLPNASVFAIQRGNEGENLGIKREGGTAEVSMQFIKRCMAFLEKQIRCIYLDENLGIFLHKNMFWVLIRITFPLWIFIIIAFAS